jgi:hypothetical protein
MTCRTEMTVQCPLDCGRPCNGGVNQKHTFFFPSHEPEAHAAVWFFELGTRSIASCCSVQYKYNPVDAVFLPLEFFKVKMMFWQVHFSRENRGMVGR